MTGWALLFKLQYKFTLDIDIDSDFGRLFVDFKSTTGYYTVPIKKPDHLEK